MTDEDKANSWKPGQRKKKSEKVDSTWNPKSKLVVKKLSQNKNRNKLFYWKTKQKALHSLSLTLRIHVGHAQFILGPHLCHARVLSHYSHALVVLRRDQVVPKFLRWFLVELFLLSRLITLIVWIHAHQYNVISRFSGKLLYSPSREFRPVRQTARRNTAGSLLNSPLEESAPVVSISPAALFKATRRRCTVKFSELKWKSYVVFYPRVFDLWYRFPHSQLLAFFRAWYWLQVFPRLSLVARFHALCTGQMFSRTFHRLPVFPRFLLVTCFSVLCTVNMFSRAFRWYAFSRVFHCFPALVSDDGTVTCSCFCAPDWFISFLLV